MLRFITTIPHPIIQSRNRFCCFDPVSDIIGWIFLCWVLLNGRWRRIHRSHHFRSAELYTIDCFPPNVTNIFLPLICFCHPRYPIYLLSSSYAAYSIISHISFFLSHHLSSISLMFLSWSPRISTAISSVILVHHPFHISCLLPMPSSTCVSSDILIRRRLRHPASMPTPSLSSYISSGSLLPMSPPSCVSTTAVLPSCAPDPSWHPITC